MYLNGSRNLNSNSATLHSLPSLLCNLFICEQCIPDVSEAMVLVGDSTSYPRTHLSLCCDWYCLTLPAIQSSPKLVVLLSIGWLVGVPVCRRIGLEGSDGSLPACPHSCHSNFGRLFAATRALLIRRGRVLFGLEHVFDRPRPSDSTDNPNSLIPLQEQN